MRVKSVRFQSIAQEHHTRSSRKCDGAAYVKKGSLPRSSFLDITQRYRCVTSNKRLRGKLEERGYKI